MGGLISSNMKNIAKLLIGHAVQEMSEKYSWES